MNSGIPGFVGISAWYQTGVGIKNNIIGGHNSGDISVSPPVSPGVDIDYNLYFNDNGRPTDGLPGVV